MGGAKLVRTMGYGIIEIRFVPYLKMNKAEVLRTRNTS